MESYANKTWVHEASSVEECQEAFQKLFAQDPRNSSYERIIYRPRGVWIRLVVGLMVFRVSVVVISIIELYQRYAPENIRRRCRYEPSCSSYMIMAIQKYGVLKGVKAGLRRIRRCGAGGGGFDYP